MPASTILLISTDAASAASISEPLTAAGYAVTTTGDADEAFGRVGEHQLVIIDVVSGSRSAADLCKEIRSTPALSAIPVMSVASSDDVEERIAFLEVGADDVLARPFDTRELEARVEALTLRFQRSRAMAPVSAIGGASDGPRKLVTVFSPKGGVGTTTIVTNVGAILARRKPDSTVVVDLDLQFGQIATHLNVQPRQTIVDLVRDSTALEEPELLRTYTTRHASGLHVLAAPANPELAAVVTGDLVGKILSTIVRAFEHVVIDAGSVLDERALVALEQAGTIVLPIYPEIAALKALHTLLDHLTETGSVAGRTTFVLNEVFARELLKVRDVESALGTRIAVRLPYDPFLYLKAVNEGIPIVIGAPRSAPAEELDRLASIAFHLPGAPDAADVHVDERRGGLLTGLLRRG